MSPSVIRLRRVGLSTLLVTASLGIAACGDDEEESTSASEGSTSATTEEESASAETIEVIATEYAFDLSATPTTETKSISVTNEGEEFHVMILAKINEGFTTEEAIKLRGEKGSAVEVATAEIPPGKTVDAKVKGPIEPGAYAMLCPVSSPKGPHYKLGQLEEFSIE